jgi:hypothetical protein
MFVVNANNYNFNFCLKNKLLEFLNYSIRYNLNAKNFFQPLSKYFFLKVAKSTPITQLCMEIKFVLMKHFLCGNKIIFIYTSTVWSCEKFSKNSQISGCTDLAYFALSKKPNKN